MARNYINHLINMSKVQQLKQANSDGQLQKEDVNLLIQINGLLPGAAPFNATDINNKEAVGSFIDHVEKNLKEK